MTTIVACVFLDIRLFQVISFTVQDIFQSLSTSKRIFKRNEVNKDD
jgi:hypothetical protein